MSLTQSRNSMRYAIKMSDPAGQTPNPPAGQPTPGSWLALTLDGTNLVITDIDGNTVPLNSVDITKIRETHPIGSDEPLPVAVARIAHEGASAPAGQPLRDIRLNIADAPSLVQTLMKHLNIESIDIPEHIYKALGRELPVAPGGGD